jgi:hypothetical protein
MLEMFAALFSAPVLVFDGSAFSLIIIGLGVWFGLPSGLQVSAPLQLSPPGRLKSVASGSSVLCRTPLAEQVAVLFVRTISDFVSTLSSSMLLDSNEFADSAGHAAAPKPFLVCAGSEQRRE